MKAQKIKCRLYGMLESCQTEKNIISQILNEQPEKANQSFVINTDEIEIPLINLTYKDTLIAVTSSEITLLEVLKVLKEGGLK